MKKILSCALTLLTLMPFASHAAVYDLTNTSSPTSVTVNQGIFQVAPSDGNYGQGTGNFDTFLWIQSDLLERGFNTDALNVLDNKPGSNFNHSVKLGDLTTFQYNNNSYMRLFLDLNEPGQGGRELVSLLDLEIWISDVGNNSAYGTNLGTKVWDLGDNRIEFDNGNLSGGSGKYDIIALFDVGLFTSHDPAKFFTLYSKFGRLNDVGYASEGGFEEWAFDKSGKGIEFCTFGCTTDPVTPVPEPAGIALLGIGLLGMGLSRKTKKQ